MAVKPRLNPSNPSPLPFLKPLIISHQGKAECLSRTGSSPEAKGKPVGQRLCLARGIPGESVRLQKNMATHGHLLQVNTRQVEGGSRSHHVPVATTPGGGIDPLPR